MTLFLTTAKYSSEFPVRWAWMDGCCTPPPSPGSGHLVAFPPSTPLNRRLPVEDSPRPRPARQAARVCESDVIPGAAPAEAEQRLAGAHRVCRQRAAERP